MAIINKPIYTKKEVSQRFNLKELLGYEPSDRQKKLFYELVVEKIVQRTADGRDINGAKFTKYTKEYAEKKGVSVNSVDLILEGDMLSSFEESQSQKNIVKIKMEEGKETLKSYNHNIGDTLPKRQFFGLSEKESLESIKRKVDSIRESSKKERSQRSETKSTIDLAELRKTIFNTIDTEAEGL